MQPSTLIYPVLALIVVIAVPFLVRELMREMNIPIKPRPQLALLFAVISGLVALGIGVYSVFAKRPLLGIGAPPLIFPAFVGSFVLTVIFWGTYLRYRR